MKLLSLKGELLTSASCEPLEEILKRIQLIKIDLESTSLDDEVNYCLSSVLLITFQQKCFIFCSFNNCNTVHLCIFNFLIWDLNGHLDQFAFSTRCDSLNYFASVVSLYNLCIEMWQSMEPSFSFDCTSSRASIM